MPNNLEEEIRLLKEVIATLIMWISQSAVSPLSGDEAKTLIELLHNKN